MSKTTKAETIMRNIKRKAKTAYCMGGLGTCVGVTGVGGMGKARNGGECGMTGFSLTDRIVDDIDSDFDDFGENHGFYGLDYGRANA